MEIHEFRKILSMLEEEALYFCRADKLGDPFEGSYSYTTSLRPIAYEGEPLQSNFYEGTIPLSQIIREYTLLNCWHLNEDESMAMWNIYSRLGEGVAIRSTFKRLKNALSASECDVKIGKVFYINFNNDLMSPCDLSSPFLYKRKCFEHEKELRAVIMKVPIKDGRFDSLVPSLKHGEYIKINLEELIDRVYVSPLTKIWFASVVRAVCKKYDLKHDVYFSSIDNTPSF